MTFEEASQLTISEKVTLVTCEAVKQVKIFSTYSGNTYLKKVDHFVASVKKDGVNMTKGSDKDSLVVGEFFFDVDEKTLYVSDSEDPKKLNLTIVYKFFFSNTPLILPHDLLNGDDVEWLPYIQNIGSVGQQLDDENVGIVLESQSTVDFINNNGFFDPIIDSLIFENQAVTFYSWFKGLSRTEIKKIFDGVVESKSFSPNKVTLRVKDFIFKLRNNLNLELFSEDDGDLLESVIGTPKRRIYGQVKQAKCAPIDCILDGYQLTGTVSIAIDSNIMSGAGTSFLDELNQDDEVIFNFQGEEVIYSVDLILSNTSLRLTKNAEQAIIDQSVIVDPEHPWRKKNRRWHVSGHKIRETIAVITNIVNARTFVVDDVSEFYPGDVVTIGPIVTQITRISGQQLVLEQNIFPIPSVSDEISRFPVTKLYYGERELIPNRDFTLTNNTEAIVELSEFAEFNIARELVTDHNVLFVDGSLTVTSSANADLRTIVKPGDFIRPTIQNNNNWYEVHHVGPQIAYLKTPFSNLGSNSNHPARIKKMEVINDDSLITIDCYGMDSGNKWIKTASDAVKHLVENDAGFQSVDEDSFNQANSDCNYILSMVIPSSIGGDSPQIRDVISDINQSVFGSLYGNATQEIAYSIVNARRPADILPIKDDDILSWDVQTNQKIVSDVKINYLPAIDKVTGEDSFSVITYQSEFVSTSIGIKNTEERTVFLFDEQDATKIAQRLAFYNSLSQSVITLKSKANFFRSSVNDKVYIDLDRLYKRYGGSSNLKIGSVSGVKKSAYNSELVMNDLGNIFNRCPVIAPGSIESFTNASQDEKIKFGYILDSDTLIPGNSEDDLGSGILG